ncbi:hypothetical protein [Pyxidicoccus caerfyrddinensis]|uniref:hypothetical protein n=1 Tax=Pyxidicoccus caerfyrddinensis TaxID=2709663 RepID=UPI0013DCCD27|nr:hypothetical protein [Pyxidicoccus caerfyrddinensis]
MPLTAEEVYQRNAMEARRRELMTQLARVRGYLDASAASSKYFARINQDTQVQRDELERQLRELDAGGTAGLTDDWGKYSALELAAQEDRYAAKAGCYDWLVAHPMATLAEAAAELERLMLEARSAAGRPWLLLRGEGLVREWQANAFARGLIPEDDWAVFRDWLLVIGKDAALGRAL